jgi:hypothetical protein
VGASDDCGVNLISDALPFGRLWYGELNAINHATFSFSAPTSRSVIENSFLGRLLHPPSIRSYGAYQEQAPFFVGFLDGFDKKLRQQLMALENKFMAMFPSNRS